MLLLKMCPRTSRVALSFGKNHLVTSTARFVLRRGLLDSRITHVPSDSVCEDLLVYAKNLVCLVMAMKYNKGLRQLK